LWYAATDDVYREGFFCCKKDDGPAVAFSVSSFSGGEGGIKLFGGEEKVEKGKKRRGKERGKA